MFYNDNNHNMLLTCKGLRVCLTLGRGTRETDGNPPLCFLSVKAQRTKFTLIRQP